MQIQATQHPFPNHFSVGSSGSHQRIDDRHTPVPQPTGSHLASGASTVRLIESSVNQDELQPLLNELQSLPTPNDDAVQQTREQYLNGELLTRDVAESLASLFLSAAKSE